MIQIAYRIPKCLRTLFFVSVMMGRFAGATTPSEMQDMLEQGGGIADSMMDQVAAAASGDVSSVMDSTATTMNKTMQLGSTVVDDLTLGVDRLMKGENPWLDYPPPIPMEESSTSPLPTEEPTEPASPADGSKTVYFCANQKVSMDEIFEAPDTQYAMIPEMVVKWDGSNWVPTTSMPAQMKEERAGR